MPTERLVSLHLRLGEKELEAIDQARPSTVARTWWIRGAIQQRLQATPTPKDERSPAPQSNGHREDCRCLSCERLRGNIQ